MHDLNLLKALDVLLDECNVTRAAQRLSLTRPAVSAMLARLRDGFGDPLFVRTQRGLVPTARALELQAPVKRVLADIDTMLRPPSFDPLAAELTVAIAATDHALQAVIVPLLPVRQDDLAARMQRGEVDLAIVTPEMTPPELHARTLYEERYVCLLRAGHRAARRGALTLDTFCALDHALVSYAGGSLSGVTDEALAQLGRSRRVTVSVTSFLVLPDILRTSELIAVAPARHAARAEGCVVREPPLAIPGFTKTLAWHERTHHSAAHRWLRALIAETTGAATPARKPLRPAK